MMGPTLFPQPSSDGGPAYDDTAISQRVTDVETAVAGKASSDVVEGVDARLVNAEADVAALKTGKATAASVTAVAARVTTLENAGSSCGAYRRVLLGIHAVTSGTTFSKDAILARPFLAGVPTNEVEVDLYLVGGGGSGQGTTYLGAQAGIGGGGPGDVRVVRGLALDSIANGLSLAVGAGGAGSTTGSAQGGTTVFGDYSARGGYGTYDMYAGPEYRPALSDLVLGRAGYNNSWDTYAAHPSLGPGAGGGARGADPCGPGGTSSPNDATKSRAGGGAATAGQSAVAESFAYGGGGGGAFNALAGAGGFPGGGGAFGTTSAPGSFRAGGGGAGVIRLACYRWVPA